jgi:hypothetical protein
VNLPKQLKIGPYTYGVEVTNDLKADDGETSLWGLCSSQRHMIYLDEKATPDRMKVILYHEVLHAAYDLYNLMDSSGEEVVCTTIGTFIVQLHLDNPALVEYLRGA